MAMDAYLATLETSNRQLERFTAKIASVCNVDDDARLLMTMPMVDFLTALTILSEILDVRRFPTPWKLVAYAGLAPSMSDSGECKRRGSITRQESRRLRYAVVETANSTTKHDERLGAFHCRIAERRGPQKARVATGREMLVIMWHMLTDQEPYRGMNAEKVKRKYKRMNWIAANSA